MEIKSTRIRWVASKDKDLLMAWVSNLPYKIEIKGNPVLEGKKWVLFYILPESPALKEIIGRDLD